MSDNISDFKKYHAQREYIVKRMLQEFKKPIHQNCFFTNLEVLQKQSDYVEFNNTRWKMRPDAFCSDYYEQHSLYPIILLVNNISTIFKFTVDNVSERIIIAPHYKIIVEILN